MFLSIPNIQPYAIIVGSMTVDRIHYEDRPERRTLDLLLALVEAARRPPGKAPNHFREIALRSTTT